MIEAVNKVIKHQFLYHKVITSQHQMAIVLEDSVTIYNTIRPQMSLKGNTPEETFNGLSLDFSRYTESFKEQKMLRNQINKENNCKVCA